MEGFVSPILILSPVGGNSDSRLLLITKDQKPMNPEIYLSVAQAADLLGISQETLYKEIQSKNLTATESPDRKRKHQVIAHSELSRLYGNIYIPDGYLEYSGDKSVDFVRIALRQENQRLRKDIGGDPDPRAKTSMTSSKPHSKTTNRSSRPTPTSPKPSTT